MDARSRFTKKCVILTLNILYKLRKDTNNEIHKNYELERAADFARCKNDCFNFRRHRSNGQALDQGGHFARTPDRSQMVL